MSVVHDTLTASISVLENPSGVGSASFTGANTVTILLWFSNIPLISGARSTNAFSPLEQQQQQQCKLQADPVRVNNMPTHSFYSLD